MDDKIRLVIFHLKERWWVMLILTAILALHLISEVNIVENISRTIQTDALCADTPLMAAKHMQKLDASWMNKLKSIQKEGWKFQGIETENHCHSGPCTFWENITFQEKSKTLLYSWTSEVEMADKSKAHVEATCYLQGGWRFGSRWMEIYDQAGYGGTVLLTDLEVWFHGSNKAIPFFE